MPTDQVQQLVAWLAETDIDLLELRGPGMLLRLGHDVGDARTLPPQAAPVAHTVRPVTADAPSVGVFLHAHPLQQTTLAAAGRRVRAGAPLGLLQIGTMLLPVCAPQAATVAHVRVAHGTLVGYGTPLVDLDPL